MRSGRSLRACDLCRRRRVKCDKTLPTCARCANFGQPCPGYPVFKTFIDQGSKARQRATRHTAPAPTPQNLVSGIVTASTSINGSPLTVPSHSSLATSRDSEDEPLQFIDSEIGPHIDANSQYFDLDIESYYADGNNACGFFADLADIEAQNNHIDQPGTSAAPAPETIVNQQGLDDQSGPQPEGLEYSEQMEDDNKTAILMRLYVEMLAPWMDLFDMEAYFTRVVPRNATFDALLKLALTAIAAKQIARYLVSPNASRYSKIFDLVVAEHASDSPDQWFYRAASYYDQGISHLRSRLQKLTEKYGNFQYSNAMDNNSSHAVPFTSLRISSNEGLVRRKVTAHEQNVLSAVSMLSFYETLDECVGGSSQHLTGFLALAKSIDAQTPSLRAEAQLLFASRSAGRAAFWYFVRKDMFTSYSRGEKPAFDTRDNRIWIVAGLPSEMFSNQHNSDSSVGLQNRLSLDITEDPQTMIFILVWLSLRVVTMIWACDKTASSSYGASVLSSPSIVFPPTQLEGMDVDRTSEWNLVQEQLKWWFEFRPQIFHPYASQSTKPAPGEGTKINKMTFFTCSTGAAVMQLYHFLQILLLLNRPSVASHASDQASRLRALKQNNQAIEFHSLEICAAALATPGSAVHRQMSHPLQLAGVYLDSMQDQAIISRTLAAVLTETCSSAETVT